MIFRSHWDPNLRADERQISVQCYSRFQPQAMLETISGCTQGYITFVSCWFEGIGVGDASGLDN